MSMKSAKVIPKAKKVIVPQIGKNKPKKEASVGRTTNGVDIKRKDTDIKSKNHSAKSDTKSRSKTEKKNKPKDEIKNEIKNEINPLCSASFFMDGNTTQLQRCTFNAVNYQKYCQLHLSLSSVSDFESNEREIHKEENNILETKNDIWATMLFGPLDEINQTEESLKQKSISDTESCMAHICGAARGTKTSAVSKTTVSKTAVSKTPLVKKIEQKTLKEQKKSNIMRSYQDESNMLEVKMLIMLNDEDMFEKISGLLGPAFDDITKSEDQNDPVTMDTFWTIKDGKKVVVFGNKYHIFSYYDSKNKIRSLTVFSLYDMFESNDFTHPITQERIPDEDISRGKKLIELYQNNLNLFSNASIGEKTPEFKIHSRITKLFAQFHIHSIFFEEKWLLNINDIKKLTQIINDTVTVVNNNIISIAPGSKKFTFYAPKMGDETKEEYIILLHEYIIEMWEIIIQRTNNPNNQIPIWIIADSLSKHNAEILEKYPSLDLMIQ